MKSPPLFARSALARHHSESGDIEGAHRLACAGGVMPVFSCTGSGIRDLWLADGSGDFAFFPQSLMRELNASSPLPIRLHVGNLAFGQVHIDHRHGHWLATLQSDAKALVWAKLQTPAQVYASDKEGALKLSFRFAPEALMVLEYREKPTAYLSVVTLYQHPRHLDGQHVGRYRPAQPQKTKASRMTGL